MNRTVVCIIILFLLPVTGDAQEKYIYDQGGKRRSVYSRQIGDKTYHYTDTGKNVGYTQQVGDQSVVYDAWGNARGYSREVGGITQYYRQDGRATGVQSVEVDAPSPGTESSGSMNSRSNISPTGSMYWGFSDPPKKSDKKEEKE